MTFTAVGVFVLLQIGEGGLDASGCVIIEPEICEQDSSGTPPVEIGPIIEDGIACGVGEDCFTNDCGIVA